jgi:Cd(II)/Pb(II)-responsive transcriptional regulator
MKIGELSKKTGCQVVTIRYYEKEGLLTPPTRTEGNYRIYNEHDLDRLAFIMHCRKHDMKLEEIKKLLAFRDQPQRDCTWITDLIDEHLENVDAQIKSLQHLKNHLQQLRHACAGGEYGKDCKILHELDHQQRSCQQCGRH